MSLFPVSAENTIKEAAETLGDRFRLMTAWLEQACLFAAEFDWLGEAEKHPEGSQERRLAELRDEADRALGTFLMMAKIEGRFRAEKTRSVDLLVNTALAARGDGPDALHLMRRYHDLSPEDGRADCDPGPESLPDSFAWDAYLRVSALPRLAEQFPLHLRHSARQMHGWPMVVSHHLEQRAEFERIADILELGAGYPLDVARRKKRGASTPLLDYLEPLVWRLHVVRSVLRETEATRGTENFVRHLYGLWWEYPDPEPAPEIIAILQNLPALPPLTRSTAREWSREAIVPVILQREAADKETCTEPALRNIWNHQSVKSRATFRSRLHSAVTGTLKRFGRND